MVKELDKQTPGKGHFRQVAQPAQGHKLCLIHSSKEVTVAEGECLRGKMVGDEVRVKGQV